MRVRGALSLFFVATAVTCTFPDVNYRRGDGGAGGDTCSAEGQCITGASTCRGPVDNSYAQCTQFCDSPNKPTCAECEADKQDGLESCALDCAACVIEKQDGCDGTASCEKLVGL